MEQALDDLKLHTATWHIETVKECIFSPAGVECLANTLKNFKQILLLCTDEKAVRILYFLALFTKKVHQSDNTDEQIMHDRIILILQADLCVTFSSLSTWVVEYGHLEQLIEFGHAQVGYQIRAAGYTFDNLIHSVSFHANFVLLANFKRQ